MYRCLLCVWLQAEADFNTLPRTLPCIALLHTFRTALQRKVVDISAARKDCCDVVQDAGVA